MFRLNRRPLLVVCLLMTVLVQTVSARAMIYRFALPGQPYNFLVGTMHSEDPRIQATLVDITPLLDRVDKVVLELVPDAVAMLAVGAATLLPAEQRLRHLVDEQLFGALSQAAVERDIPVATVDRLRPWAVALLLGMPEAATGRFLDNEIYLAAAARGLPVSGLENVAEQVAIFRSMPLPMQLALLDETIKNRRQLPKQLEDLTRVYLDGDAQRLERVGREQFDSMPTPIARWFDDRLLLQRNRRMLQRMQPLLAEGPVMVAVGAMHLGGESGLLAGLRRLGFEVTRWPD
jgi:uncharacterized protein YbaP (TraB family)